MNPVARALIFFASATLVACGGGSHPPPRTGDLGSFIAPGPGPDPVDMAMPKGDMATVTDACAAPIPVMDGTMLSGQDTSSSTTTLPDVCVYGGEGNLLYYSATIPPGQKMSFTVTPTDGVFDPVLRLFDACGDTECPAYADSGFAGDAETVTLANTAATPRTVLVAVAGYDAGGGTYDVSVKIAALPANASCSGAKPITTAAPLTGEDAAGAGDTISACLSWSDGGVLYYSTTLPARTELVATATPTGGSWDPSIRILDSCGAADCVASADDGYTGEAETLTYRNKTTSPMPILIAVGGQASGAGTFDLSIAETALPPPATNTSCAMATTLTDGTMLAGQDATDGIDTLTTACLPGASGSVLYYKATVPAGSSLKVHVMPTGTGSIDPVIRILSACGATSCLTSADDTYSGGEETATYKNTTASPVTVIVAVGAYSDSSSGSFDLDATISALPAPPSNLDCASATAVANGTSLTAQDQQAATVAETALCLPSANGGVLFYKATIPAGQKLLALAKPSATFSFDPVVRLLDSCGATSCLASADAGNGGDSELLSYKNTTASAMPVIFTVGSYASATTGVFDLDTYIKSAPSNLTCAAATAVTSGTSLPVEDGESATASMTTACVPSATGKTLFYKISIPAGKTLKADVAPLGSWDPVIRLVSTCSATTCLASQDAGYSGDPESLSYTNSGASAVAVTLAVGAYGATTGAFSLAVSIN